MAHDPPDFSVPARSSAWHSTCLRHNIMAADIIVMPGFAQLDLQALQAVAGEFGWAVRVAEDLREAGSAQTVLFHRDALGSGCSWLDAVRQLKQALPGARLVACHGLGEFIDWPELCDAGAFHAIRLPLKANEVRKSLGFISAARKVSGTRSTPLP
jgi:hypothetical protein